MTPPTCQVLFAPLLLAAERLGFQRVVLRTAPGHERTVWLGLVHAGARRFRRVLHYDGEPPYVIDVAELTLSGLVIEAHAPPRPASPGECAALESDEAFLCIDSCRVVEISHVD